MQMIRQTMFTTGEVDAINYKRTDIEAYLTSAQSLKNCEVGTTGLVKKRKGSAYAINASNYAIMQSKMYEFIDKYDNHYLILSSFNFNTNTPTWYVFTVPRNRGNDLIVSSGDHVITGRGSNVVVGTNTLTLVQSITGMPYQVADLDDIDYTRDNDSLILSHPDYPPGRIYAATYNSENATSFAFQSLKDRIYPYPAYDFNDIDYNQFTVNLSVADSVLTFQFTGLTSDPGFNDDWVGGQIIGGGATPEDPVGYAIITAVSYGGGTVTFTADVQVAFKTSGFATKGNQYSIKKKAWSDSLGWPAKVLYYQNRVWYGNTYSLPNTVFGSKINKPLSYDVGTGKDTDAIIYTIGQTNSGSIKWLNGGKQLEIFTSNYEFACPQDTNTALTPSTFSIRQQSAYGSSSRLKPVSYINNSYFSSRTGKALINYHFNGVGLAYQ